MATVDRLFWPRALVELPRGFTVIDFDAAKTIDVGEPGAVLQVGTDRGAVTVFAWRLRKIAGRHTKPRCAARALARQVRQVQRGRQLAGVVPTPVLEAAAAGGPL